MMVYVLVMDATIQAFWENLNISILMPVSANAEIDVSINMIFLQVTINSVN